MFYFALVISFPGAFSSISIEDGLTSVAHFPNTGDSDQRKRRSADGESLRYTRMSITGGARVALRGDFERLNGQYMLSGDFTGWLHVRQGQTVVIGMNFCFCYVKLSFVH